MNRLKTNVQHSTLNVQRRRTRDSPIRRSVLGVRCSMFAAQKGSSSLSLSIRNRPLPMNHRSRHLGRDDSMSRPRAMAKLTALRPDTSMRPYLPKLWHCRVHGLNSPPKSWGCGLPLNRDPKSKAADRSALSRTPKSELSVGFGECGHGALGGRSYRFPISSVTQRSPRTARYPPYQGFMGSMHDSRHRFYP